MLTDGKWNLLDGATKRRNAKWSVVCKCRLISIVMNRAPRPGILIIPYVNTNGIPRVVNEGIFQLSYINIKFIKEGRKFCLNVCEHDRIFSFIFIILFYNIILALITIFECCVLDCMITINLTVKI